MVRSVILYIINLRLLRSYGGRPVMMKDRMMSVKWAVWRYTPPPQNLPFCRCFSLLKYISGVKLVIFFVYIQKYSNNYTPCLFPHKLTPWNIVWNPFQFSSQEYFIKQIPIYSDVCSDFPSVLTIYLVNYYLSGVCLYSCNTASNFLLLVWFFLKTMSHSLVFRMSSQKTIFYVQENIFFYFIVYVSFLKKLFKINLFILTCNLYLYI